MSCSSDEQSDKECPLCMELLEIDDVDFYPCKCEYQICRFCWHRLKNDENGLCPACRQPYPEDPVNFKPLSSADLQRIKDEKKLKAQAEKMRISESRKHLANYRVLQKNLVYVVGLSSRFASEEVLRKQEFFGRFGKIQKIVLGTSPNTNLPAHLQPSHTAYITYNREDEALRAIQGVNNTNLDGRMIKASLGTTKYCSSFLRTQTCGKPECMYLHDIAEEDISFTKEDMHAGKHSDYERKLIENMLLRRQAYEKRQVTTSHLKNHFDQNGADIDDADVQAESYIDDSERTGLNNDNLLAERQYSQENREIDSPRKQSSTTHSTHSQELDHDSSYSSLNADSTDHQNLETEKSIAAPPGYLPSPPGLVNSSSNNSIEDSTSKFLRLMNLDGGGKGSVPALASQEEAPAPLTNWQTLLGLTPQEPPKRRNPSPTFGLKLDDDLGFDPFSESTKGLAALLQEEEVERNFTYRPSAMPTLQSYHQQKHQQPTTHRQLSDLWGGLGNAPNGVQQSRSHTSFSSNSPFDMFGLTSNNHMPSSYSHGSHSYHNHHPAVPAQYNDYTAAQQHYNHQQQHQQRQMNFAPPPGLAPRQQQQPQSQSIQNLAEWQEGLRALLPNVNVKFSSDFEQQSAQRWNPAQAANNYNQMHQMMSQHSVPPPPGFSIPNR